jgi:hypothetical protein
VRLPRRERRHVRACTARERSAQKPGERDFPDAHAAVAQEVPARDFKSVLLDGIHSKTGNTSVRASHAPDSYNG